MLVFAVLTPTHLVSREHASHQMTTTVHLLHGLPGCGKTRFAKQLAAERRCVHLSHDEWVVRLFGSRPTIAQIEAVREPIHEMLWTTLSRIVEAGSDVVLDFGFWTRNERDQARERAHRAGAAHLLYTFECSPQVAWERVKRRNGLDSADSLQIDEQTFWLLAGRIEPLMPDEVCISVPG
jgi:predicted kinase